MPGFLQYYLPSVLLLSCLFSNISSQRKRVKTLEVPVSSVIHITDGRQRYFNLTSAFIAENPLVTIESSEQAAKYYVTVMDSVIHAKKYCPEPITITAYTVATTATLCHGTGSPMTVLIKGNFSMQFKSNAANHTPTEVHILRFLLTNTTEPCQYKTDHKCGFRCFGSDAVCDGQKHCRDASDEENCSSTSSSTYDTTTARVMISTTPAGTRRCDLPGATVKDPPEDDFKKSWSVVVYSTGIIIGTVFCSFVIGFCFMHPSPDDQETERDRREANEDGERRLDPLLDHPPSYEDVMNMNLSAAPHHRQTVPKPHTSTSESP